MKNPGGNKWIFLYQKTPSGNDHTVNNVFEDEYLVIERQVLMKVFKIADIKKGFKTIN